MSVWTSTPTQKGLALQSKLLSTDKLEITRVVSGAGSVPVGQLSVQTAVSDIKQELTVESLTYDENGKGLLRVMIDNYTLQTGYSMYQIGIYANDPDEGEILYVIAQVTDVAEKIPSITEQPAGFTCGWAFRLAFSNSSNFSITISPDAFITTKAADERYATKEEFKDVDETVKTALNVASKANANVSNKKSLKLEQTNISEFNAGEIDLDDYTTPGEWHIAPLFSNQSSSEWAERISNLPPSFTQDIDNFNQSGNCSVMASFKLMYESFGFEHIINQSFSRLVGLQTIIFTDNKFKPVIYKRLHYSLYNYDNDVHTKHFSSWCRENATPDATYLGSSAVLNEGNNLVNNNFAVVGGYQNTAHRNQTVFGKFADTSGSADKGGVDSNSATTGSLFVIGNGTTNNARANVFRASASGRCYGSQAFGSSGADYAEFFEWLDGNPDNEDRRGMFVTLDGEYIRVATSEDDYILGVVSATPSIVGDVHSESWKNMYLRDVFGERITEVVTVPETVDEETGETIPEHTETRWILNPDYDSSKGYLSRDERQEWAAVGLMGKLIVTDDGSCQVNGYCSVSSNGTATASDSGYRVMKRIDDTHIKILFR